MYTSCVKLTVRGHGSTAVLLSLLLFTFRQKKAEKRLTVLGRFIFPPGGAMMRLLGFSRAPTASLSSSVFQISSTRLDLSIITAPVRPIPVLLLQPVICSHFPSESTVTPNEITLVYKMVVLLAELLKRGENLGNK